MKFERYTTPEGWPGVHWEQTVPTGETLYARQSELQWRFAVLLGLVVFGVLVGMGLPLLWAVVGSLIVALVLSSSEIRSGIEARAGRGGAGVSENERQLEAEARVMRYGRLEKRWAELVLDGGSRSLWFVVLKGEAEARRMLFRVPLVDFDELQLGTDEEWLGDAGTRELREIARFGSTWVIVAQTASAGVRMVAQSAGSKKEIAELHRALTAAFVAGRAAQRARLEEVVGDA